MELYIHGAGIVSAVGNNAEEKFLLEAPQYETDRLLCKEPNYTGIVPPMQLRRMSKAVRMGIGASHICMEKSGSKPDAISIGTAMGCLHDTEVFLSKLVEQNEQMLSPTAFIQSTHNTVGGQIALLNNCYGHNMTYVHRGHSFEHAFINAQLYLNDHPEEKMLVGGLDELTETSLIAMKQSGVYTDAKISAQDVVESNGHGSIAGEGAAFFMVSKSPAAENSLCVKDIHLFVSKDEQAALQKVKTFTEGVEGIDLVVFGINGDEKVKGFYGALAKDFSNIPVVSFKHLCGEYATASAFGLGMLAHLIKEKTEAEHLIPQGKKSGLRNIVMINNYLHYYSCWHISIR